MYTVTVIGWRRRMTDWRRVSGGGWFRVRRVRRFERFDSASFSGAIMTKANPTTITATDHT